VQISPQNLQQANNTFQYANIIGGDLFPSIAPRMSVGGQVANAGYTVFDIFRTAKTTYYNQPADWTKAQRLELAAKKSGDTALIDLIAMFAVPLILGHPIHRGIQKLLRYAQFKACLDKIFPKSSKQILQTLQRHHRLATLPFMTVAGLLLAKPIDKATDLLMNWTYRPLVLGQTPPPLPRINSVFSNTTAPRN
jgi:hypothetical protein